jgi:hypothetical protein
MLELIKIISGLNPDVALLGGVLLAINIYNAYRSQYREQMIMTILSTEGVKGARGKAYIVPLEIWQKYGLLGPKVLP